LIYRSLEAEKPSLIIGIGGREFDAIHSLTLAIYSHFMGTAF
jgi:hypothetical protein